MVENSEIWLASKMQNYLWITLNGGMIPYLLSDMKHISCQDLSAVYPSSKNKNTRTETVKAVNQKSDKTVDPKQILWTYNKNGGRK